MKKKGLLLIIFTINIGVVFAQQSYFTNKADASYRQYEYSKAIVNYQKALDREPQNIYIIRQLALCCQKLEDYKEALSYYEIIVSDDQCTNEDLYQYATLLLINNQPEKAQEQFAEYLEKVPNDKRATNQIALISNSSSLNILSFIDSVSCIPFNTQYSDMSAAYYKNTIAFVSARDSTAKNVYVWNNQPFLDIYSIDVDKDGNEYVKRMKGVNTEYHEGPMCFTNNNNTIWFTRNFRKYNKELKEKVNNIRIYSSQNRNGVWMPPKEFIYNSNDYSTGHPTFSSDGNTMYFASNMKGSIGNSDIFKVEKNKNYNKKNKKDKEWLAPENLGSQINTKGKEVFPFVDARGIIFFASDGISGYGGLDIYAAYPTDSGYDVVNLGQPINSVYDDFSFIVTDDFRSGYFTSNRPGGKGSDDIYSFKIEDQGLCLVIKSQNSDEVLANSDITIRIENDSIIKRITDSEGQLCLNIDFNKDYYFEVNKEKYHPNTDSLLEYQIFSLKDRTKTIYLNKVPSLLVKVIDAYSEKFISNAELLLSNTTDSVQKFMTDSLGEFDYSIDGESKLKIVADKYGYQTSDTTIVFNVDSLMEYATIIKLKIEFENIYYDLDSANIRTDAAVVLDRIYNILERTDINIEIGSHTDCRAPDDYNMRLSQRRAQSVVDYLVARGIDKERLTAVGYGETQPINKYEEDRPCSEEEHQQNRRTEFKVIK